MNLLLKNIIFAGVLLASMQTANAIDAVSRIIDGSSTTTEAHPSFVAVETDSSCGGSLIAPQWVMTAAHCVVDSIGRVVSPSDVRIAIQPKGIKYGSIRANSWRAALSVIPHPLFSLSANDYDIALIKLQYPVDNVTPAVLNSDSSELVGQIAIAVGLGSTTRQFSDSAISDLLPTTIQQVQLPIVDWNICNDVYSDGIPAHDLCVGFQTFGGDTCYGDSGGPLYIQQGNKEVQIGITSFGNGCGVGHVAGYVDVSKFKSFFHNNGIPVVYNNKEGISSVTNLTGLWYDPAKNGSGFNIMHNDDFLSVYYYGYRNNGLPQWLMSTTMVDLPLKRHSTITLNMNTSTYGNHATFDNPPTTVNSGTGYWGKLELKINSCGSLTATLNGLDGSTKHHLQKLMNPKNFACSD